MKLGIVLVLFGGFTLLLYLVMVLTVLHSHQWDWIDAFWLIMGASCLCYGTRRLKHAK